MRRIQVVARTVLGVFLILHGLVHAMGVLGSWELATFEGISYRPNILLDDAGDGIMRLLGVFWLVTGMAVVTAGIAVLRRTSWWPWSVLASALVSLPVTVLWIEDAIAGVVINLAVLIGVLAWIGWTALTREHPGKTRSGMIRTKRKAMS